MKIIQGSLKNRTIQSLKTSNITRPTTGKLRETVFNICQNSVENAHFLDLFAGSGAMGIEAISRGAKHVTFVEKNPSSLKILLKNIHTLSISSFSHVYKGDALQYLIKTHHKQFDIIYIDPPYHSHLAQEALLLIDKFQMLSFNGILFVEVDIKQHLIHTSLQYLYMKKFRKSSTSLLYQFHVNHSLINS